MNRIRLYDVLPVIILLAFLYACGAVTSHSSTAPGETNFQGRLVWDRP